MEISVLRLGHIGTNCYIFHSEGSSRCGIIDPGGQGAQLAKWLKEQGLEPEAVLLTHGHFDHILAVPELRAQWPGLPVYCHPADFGEEETINMFGQPFPTVCSFGNVAAYKEGDTVTVAGVELTVLETPGHTPGSVTLKAGDVLFTGDTLFAGSMGRTDFPGGDEDTIMASLKRLCELNGDFRVCPGHEGQSTLERERNTNYCLRAAMSR